VSGSYGLISLGDVAAKFENDEDDEPKKSDPWDILGWAERIFYMFNQLNHGLFAMGPWGFDCDIPWFESSSENAKLFEEVKHEKHQGPMEHAIHDNY